jgi:hypothetical protein
MPGTRCDATVTATTNAPIQGLAMPDDDEIMTGEQRKELFKEWTEDYALRREENNNRRLPPPAGGDLAARPSAEILPFPAAGPPRPWPSEIAKTHRPPSSEPPAKGKGNEPDTGHSL